MGRGVDDLRCRMRPDPLAYSRVWPGWFVLNDKPLGAYNEIEPCPVCWTRKQETGRDEIERVQDELSKYTTAVDWPRDRDKRRRQLG